MASRKNVKVRRGKKDRGRDREKVCVCSMRRNLNRDKNGGFWPENGEGEIECGEFSLPPEGKFGEPRICNLSVVCKARGVEFRIGKIIAPKFMARMSTETMQSFPSGRCCGVLCVLTEPHETTMASSPLQDREKP